MAYLEYEKERIAEVLDEAKTSMGRYFDQLAIMESALNFLDDTVPSFDPEDGSYGYIPVNLSDMLECIFDLFDVLKQDPSYQHPDLPIRPTSLVEIGCGTGRNILLLKQLETPKFNKVLGFDIAAPYIQFGIDTYKLSDADLLVADAMNFDYSGFDVMQFYRPFHEEEMEIAFEKRMVENMQRGSYVIGHSSVHLSEAPMLMEVGKTGRVWKRL